MSNFYPRPVSKNYLRNGGFENVNMLNWSGPSGVLSHSIVSNSYYGSGLCLECLTNSSTVVLQHTDYIAVLEGEHIDIISLPYSSQTGTILLELERFTANMKYIDSITYSATVTAGNYDLKSDNIRIPKNTAYIRFKTVLAVPVGSTIRLGDFGLRIQDSKDAILKTTYLKAFEVARSTPITPGNSETYTLAPTDSEGVYKLKAFSFTADRPGGSTTGLHGLYFKSGNIDLQIAQLLYSYTSKCEYFNCIPQGTPAGYQPGTELHFYQVLKDIPITKTSPLKIIYKNDTNGTHDTTRSYKFLLEADILDNIEIL